VGTGVGAGVGTGVGTGVGFGVGTGVGTGVGAGVGTGVGTGVGFGVGTGVGTGVGAGVGAGVGTGVGAGVGTGVGFGCGVGCGFSVGVMTGGGAFGAFSGEPATSTYAGGETLEAETGIATNSSHASTAGRSAGRANREWVRAFKELRFLGAGRARRAPVRPAEHRARARRPQWYGGHPGP
jgi:hypothetical protein